MLSDLPASPGRSGADVICIWDDDDIFTVDRSPPWDVR